MGQVASVRKQETALFQSASVQPVVDFTSLRAVLVVTNFKPVDLAPLINRLGRHKRKYCASLLLSLPILAFVLMLQTIIVSTLPLLSGYADLVLLVLVAWALQERARSAWVWAVLAGSWWASSLPLHLGVPLVGYLVVTAIARLFRRRVWQTPILSMFLVTFFGSLITQGLAMGVLIFRARRCRSLTASTW